MRRFRFSRARILNSLAGVFVEEFKNKRGTVEIISDDSIALCIELGPIFPRRTKGPKECSALLLTTRHKSESRRATDCYVKGVGLQATLTCIKDVAVFIFWVHAVSEKFGDFIIAQFFT